MIAPGLLIAAPRSGSGKTTITLGLQRALVRRGLTVRGLKCGPDYIDPAFHAAATGAPSANLDSFAMPDALLGAIAYGAADAADLVIAEGSMGLFDAVPGPEGHTGASADIAALLGWPVVLVIDVSGQAQSAAAIALGCMHYDPRIRIAGVILNKVASERHRRLVAQGMAKIGLPVLGSLPREASLILPERHLGLVQAGETDDLHARLDALAEAIAAAVDLDAVVAAAGPTMLTPPGDAIPALPAPGPRIAIARDAAFSFVYPHVEAGWRAAGATLLPFSPLANEAPPEDCDVCWLPGGYPELHASTIAGAAHFLKGLRQFAESRPVHGECGGYMVLGQSLTDADGVSHAMAGLLGVETSFARRKMNLGYRRAVLQADGPLGQAGQALTGHEFHYATIVATGDDPPFAVVTDPHGSPPAPAGSRRGHVTGSFFHAIAVAA
ncbi:cobyrinate a,c-diamide synthase [Bosea lathyri]|uniref:Hydrogenobyrinate a,c-diamide synthase n=1 Tax=Bosea lathyri TaxID=1036778 RepID=A0A1H6D5G3_9HYPH|nr:cobyrinate a,c-diamide synthase [Bosea lathyri]SEG80550.1 cobyrinic acid a,c-diamide synthase [Bosea lathyri]